MLVDIDEQLVCPGALSPDIAVMKGHEVERFFRQAVTSERQRLGVEKFAVHTFDPTGFAANIPGRSEVARPVFKSYFDPVSRLKFSADRIHGSPHRESNSASLRSISSVVRIFFSTSIASILAIQRS